jgi:hypothetical protein
MSPEFNSKYLKSIIICERYFPNGHWGIPLIRYLVGVGGLIQTVLRAVLPTLENHL